MRRTILTVAATAALAFVTSATHAAVINFEGATDFADNFTENKNTKLFQTTESGNGFVRLSKSTSGTDSGAWYGTGLSSTWPKYLTDTVQVDLRFAVFTGINPAILVRSTTDGNGSGIAARISSLAADSIGFQLKYNAQAASTAGTVFNDQTISLASGTLSTGTWYTFKLEQKAGADPEFKASLLSGSSTIATTGWQAFTTNDTYNAAGFVSFGANNGSTGGNLDFDNFTIVPEPAALTLLGLGGLMMLRRRSR